MTIETLIRKWISDNNQIEAARLLGKDRSTISKIQNGEIGIRLSDIDRLAEAAGIRILGPDQCAVSVDRYRALLHFSKDALHQMSQELE